MLSKFQFQEPVTPKDPHADVKAASAVTPRLISDLMALGGVRLQDPASPDVRRLQRLIDAEAWTDAALALIEIALPDWRLVRLITDDGEWSCARSCHWQLPDWLDDAIEARREVLPLAILAAFIAARRASRAPNLRSVPKVRTRRPHDTFDPIWCENSR